MPKGRIAGSCGSSTFSFTVLHSDTSQVANAGDIRDVGLIPGSGRAPGGGHGNPLQYSCLENPLDRGAWRATVHRVAKSQTQLSDLAQHSTH